MERGVLLSSTLEFFLKPFIFITSVVFPMALLYHLRRNFMVNYVITVALVID